MQQTVIVSLLIDAVFSMQKSQEVLCFGHMMHSSLQAKSYPKDGACSTYWYIL